MVRESLELRDNYVYREEIAPWTKEPVMEPGTPKASGDPFHFEPVEKSAVRFFFLFFFFLNIVLKKSYNISTILIEATVIKVFSVFYSVFVLFMQHHFRMEDGVIHVYASESGMYH